MPSALRGSHRDDKTCAIAERLASLESVGPGDIANIFHEVVDPGFRAEAAHTLRTWLPEQADHFLVQCFQFVPRERSLYTLRNSINHGAIDINDPEATLIVSARFSELWMLDFSLFRRASSSIMLLVAREEQRTVAT